MTPPDRPSPPGPALTRRTLTAAVALAALLLGAAYLWQSTVVVRDLREGRAAYERLCARLTASAARSGSPGAVSHLVAAIEVELRALARRHPRWYESYLREPEAYRCPDVRSGRLSPAASSGAPSPGYQ